jgi:hypothetical protein
MLMQTEMLKADRQLINKKTLPKKPKKATNIWLSPPFAVTLQPKAKRKKNTH